MSRRSDRSRSSSSRSRVSTPDSSGAVMGFKMYSNTFMPTAWRAYSNSSKPENTTSLAAGSRGFSRPHSSRPSM